MSAKSIRPDRQDIESPDENQSEIILPDEEPVDVIQGEEIEIEPDFDSASEKDALADIEPEEVSPAVEMSDDPVRLYLKEIGRVDLLSPDQEMWLSVRTEAVRRRELLKTGRAERRKESATLQAIYTEQYDDMRTAWNRVCEDSAPPSIKENRI